MSFAVLLYLVAAVLLVMGAVAMFARALRGFHQAAQASTSTFEDVTEDLQPAPPSSESREDIIERLERQFRDSPSSKDL